jgi:hypothetical protein
MYATRNLRACILISLLILAASPAKAQQEPRALVSTMVNNELSVTKRPEYWLYQETDQKGANTVVKNVLETPDCWLTWPVSYNGNPPTPQQQKQAQQAVDRLVKDPAARRRNRAAIDQDSRKADALMKMLPDAFLYAIEGKQDGKIRLSFTPNPKFSPPSPEAKVFHKMKGVLVIDEKETRLESLSGQLTSDVTFGAGILGRLRKGGTFHVAQSEVAPGEWEVTLLDVHITGRALFFKTISQQQHQRNTDFRTLPPNLTLAEAASLLKKEEETTSASTNHMH